PSNLTVIMKLKFIPVLLAFVCLGKLSHAQTTFTNNDTIFTHAFGPGNPFPSELPVSGLDPYTTKVVVTLHNVSIPSIVCNQVYIESPTGQQVCLFSKSGSAFFITEGDLSFDQDAINIPPTSYGGDFLPGTYLPSMANSQDLPAGISIDLNTFNNSNPNGTWKLYENGIISATTAEGHIASWSLTITSNNGPLPLNLTRFNAQKQNGKAVLTWETAQEQNTALFEIERSTDGILFETLGQVRASGNSSEVKHYTYTDRQPAAGGNYYRLKMVDQDQKTNYSDVRELSFASAQVLIYPNPFKEQLFINRAAIKGNPSLRIVTITGTEVFHQQLGQAALIPVDV